MEHDLFQIMVQDPWKVDDTKLVGALYETRTQAAVVLTQQGFVMMSPDNQMWSNGATEAWIVKRPLNPVLGKEEVQLR